MLPTSVRLRQLVERQVDVGAYLAHLTLDDVRFLAADERGNSGFLFPCFCGTGRVLMYQDNNDRRRFRKVRGLHGLPTLSKDPPHRCDVVVSDYGKPANVRHVIYLTVNPSRIQTVEA